MENIKNIPQDRMKTYGQYFITDENGLQVFNPFDYLAFYEANVHPYTILELEDKEHKIYEGITALEFQEMHKVKFWDILQPVIEDKRLIQLQNELQKEGKQVCMFNMYILAKFLIERGKTRYVILLKPKISDILATLKGVSKISFKNEDGTIIKSESPKLIQIIMEAMEEKKDADQSNMEVEKVVTWNEVSNKSVMQSYFVNDLTYFLNKYFPVKRRKDALVSTKEVELILYLMKLFGLSTTELTNKRYWQLLAESKRLNSMKQSYGQFNINGEKVIIPITFIPYSIWNNGKVDWTNDESIEQELKVGDTIKF